VHVLHSYSISMYTMVCLRCVSCHM